MITSHLLMLGMLADSTLMLEVEAAFTIADADKRAAALTEIGDRLVVLGTAKVAAVEAAAADSAPEPEIPQQRSAQSAEPDALPAPADEVERLIDRIAETATSAEGGYRDLLALHAEGGWTSAHIARAARRRADLEHRFATAAAAETLGAVAV